MPTIRPRICAAIVSGDIEKVKKAQPYADLFEVRIDLIGNDWAETAQQIKTPWCWC